jgi:hypothetical protein
MVSLEEEQATANATDAKENAKDAKDMQRRWGSRPSSTNWLFLSRLGGKDLLKGGGECAAEDAFGRVETDEGHAHASPAAGCGGEVFGGVGQEFCLLFGCEFEGSEAFCAIGERGEDARVCVFADAEVGRAHVRGFDGAGQREREAAKGVWVGRFG